MTPKARERLEKLSVIQKQVNNLNFECFSREEFFALHELVGRLLDYADRALPLMYHLAGTPRVESK